LNKNKKAYQGDYLSSPTTGSVSSYPFAYTHEILIDRDIDNPANWREEIQCIRNAGPNDVVHMLINTDGGRLDTAFAIINAMQHCQGKIITELVGSCCSAGTAIFVHGDEFIINELQVNFMIHQASHGYAGIDSHVYDYAVHSREHLKTLYKAVYGGFLSDEEIDSVTNGRELWLKPEEILERCNNKIKHDGELSGVPEYTREFFEEMTKEQIIDILFPQEPEELSEEQVAYDELVSKTKKVLETSYNMKAKTKELLIEKIMDEVFEVGWKTYVKLK